MHPHSRYTAYLGMVNEEVDGMARTLKKLHEDKRVKELRERMTRVDAVILAENRAARLLSEAMDDQDLEKVSAIVQKLGTIKTPELPKLKAAIEQAEAEVNKYTGGGPLTKAWAKMKDLVGIDNPVVKVTAFADALEKGFSQIPQILKNNGVDLKDVDLNKSLVQVLGRLPTAPPRKKTPAKDDKPSNWDSEMKDLTSQKPGQVKGPFESVQNEADGDQKNVEGKIKNVTNQLQKALSPGGIFGFFKKVPYIDSTELATELVRAPLRVFSTVVKRINSGAKAAEVAPDLKAQIAGAGAAETKGTEPGAPSKQTSQTSPSAPARPTTASSGSVPAGEATPKPQGGGKLSPNYAMARQKITRLMKSLGGKQGAWDELARKLVDAGLDPNKL